MEMFATTVDEIVEMIKEHFANKENKGLDLTALVQSKIDMHSPMNPSVLHDVVNRVRASRNFEVVEYGGFMSTRYFVARLPKGSWTTRKPFLFAVIICVITALLTLGVELLISKAGDREQRRIDNQQEKSLSNLSDSLTKIQKNLNDSIAKLRNDVNKKGKKK